MSKIIKLTESELVKMIKEQVENVESSDGILKESSLSRVWHFSEEYDVAIITAFRKINMNCSTGDNDGHRFTKKENLERNKDLLAVLLKKGYGVTKVDGSYIENFQTPQSIEVAENSFFVVNREGERSFLHNIIELGKYFCQDSVLIKLVGLDAYLYGTNHNDFPGYEEKVKVGSLKPGIEAEFMSRVKGRPFTFGEDYSVNSRYLISQRAKKIMPFLK